MDTEEHAQQIFSVMLAARYIAEKSWPANLEQFAANAQACADAFAKMSRDRSKGETI